MNGQRRPLQARSIEAHCHAARPEGRMAVPVPLATELRADNLVAADALRAHHDVVNPRLGAGRAQRVDETEAH